MPGLGVVAEYETQGIWVFLVEEGDYGAVEGREEAGGEGAGVVEVWKVGISGVVGWTRVEGGGRPTEFKCMLNWRGGGGGEGVRVDVAGKLWRDCHGGWVS